jgi:hypothetical protein
MKSTLVFALISVYGLCIRLLFAMGDGFVQIMSLTFLALTPLIIGYLTVRFTSAKSMGVAFLKPWLTSLIILFITIFLNVEGTICWIIIFPFFAIFAGIGGVIAFVHTQKSENRQNSDENDDILDSHNTFKVSLIFLLPLIFGVVEGDRTQSRRDFTISKTVIISKSPTEVWNSILNVKSIKNEETGQSFATILGFPNHLETTLDTLKIGGKRTAAYEKGLVFEEIITKYEPERLLVLDVNTDPNKIPPTVMDEHIVIGGKHLDILEDIYQLEALPDGTTRVSLSSRFFINTPFNWYASLWAEYLMKDILENELEIIQKSAESEQK